jgi:hypothetical protein
VKDDPGLKIPGVYGIPCECGKTYIGQTNRTIETRHKEHMRHLRLGQPDKSAVAHDLETGHRVEFNYTCRLAGTKGYIDRIIKEASEIKLHPDINGDGGYILSRDWQPVLRQIGTSQQGLRAQQYKEPAH